jgi:hypothetical protein
VPKLNCIPLNTQNGVLDRENKTLALFVKYNMKQIYLISKTFTFVLMMMMMMMMMMIIIIIIIHKLKMECCVMRYAEFAKAFFIVKYPKVL